MSALLLGAAWLAAARAAEPKVDADLLEFLGSVDTEDKNWHDYLARTDIEKVAQRAPHAPAAPAPPSPSPPPGAARPGEAPPTGAPQGHT